MSEVFADSFYYIALLNPHDRFHAPALAATTSLNCRLVTTLWVLMEVADALSAPAVRQRTRRCLKQLSADPATTVVMETSWYSRGLELYGKRADKNWSLTDCISFELMTDRQIAEALTGDHHFTQAGFRAML
jgi:predicted nucleic acid-binding protein